MKYLSLVVFFICIVPVTAFAQNEDVPSPAQPPVEEGTAFTQPPMEAPEIQPATPARLEVRISNMEDEMRKLRGKNEELDFQVRKLNDTIEKLQRDIDMRFGDLNKTSGDTKSQKLLSSEPRNEKTDDKTTTAGDGILHAPGTTETSTPRDLYNYAFRLFNQTKYDEAAKSFDAFTKQYPKDPLVGNAYYWMGETHYIRRDHVAAADYFRQGFEASPTGPKAADNLYKLALSLNVLKKEKDACVVLQQIASKFKKGATSIVSKAEAEYKRLGCK